MAVKFYQRNVTVNGKTFTTKFFIGDPGDFVVEPTCIANSTDTGSNALTWGSQGVYGTNASFFGTDGTPSGTEMTALHIYNSKNMVDKNGNKLGGYYNYETQGDSASAMDYIYYMSSNNSVGVIVKSGLWEPNATIPSMQWGVGGFNMMLSDTSLSSQSIFDTALKKYYPKIKVAYNTSVSRTAIGYRGSSDKKIVLAAFFGLDGTATNGPTMYEVRLLMNYLGCSLALCLDGSNLTKISYKQNGVNKGIDNGSRQSWCRIRLTVAAASTTDWTGV